MVRFMTFEMFHGKGNIGSTNLRVHQLIKYWNEADIYKYGEKADVLIFQKVYWTPDYHFPITYKGGLKILDICDPDWLDSVYVKRTIDGMDAVVCPSEYMAEFLRQLTDKPVKVIPDRFDLEQVPKPKTHEGKIKTAVWFGYSHNSEVLEGVVKALEERNISLLVISDDDPIPYRWANDVETYKKKCKFIKYKEETFYESMHKADICLIPKGNRPKDKYKSNNRTVKSWLAGLPVVTNLEELETMQDSQKRNKVVQSNYKKAIAEYDVKLSIQEYKELIDGIHSRD